MKRVLAAMMLAALPFYGCAKSEVNTAAKAEATGAEKPESRKIILNIDMFEQKRLQEAADQGGHAWRKEAIDVAHAALINYGVNAKPDDCKITVEHEDHAVVNAACKDGNFNVHLKRLVKPGAGGIWTATEIETTGDAAGHDRHM